MAEDATAVNETEVVDTSTTDSAPVETAEEPTKVDQSESTVEQPEDFDDGEYASSDDLPKDKEPEAPEEKSDEEDDDKSEEQEKPQSKGEQRKEQLNTEIRDLVAQRNHLKQQVEQLNTQAYQVPSEQDLQDQINPDTGEYYTALEAKLTRMEQQQQLRDYTERVTEAQLAISAEAQRALKDFPMFDSSSPNYDPEIAQEADAILQQNLVVDPNTGQIVGSRISPYQLYKSYDVATKTSQRKAQIQGQKSVEKMISASAPTTGGRGTERTFSKMSLQEKAEYLRKKGHDV